ncbi:hypothetical protein HMPREF9990_08245 [Staphylococcus epidermidis NIHLM061]|uniref:hypothetical protein n=1 Tax=Staphylococcus epidermidis TaxID=1282 RepID=UPI00026C1BAF|nr:hypothetical protein [Staphylococcus epidermidis]EJD87791.1 hypothetical protein HMPREF9990_08245 [Staphylococcus epidermidis NIHLM061]
MYKQIFNKSDGAPKLIETGIFDTEQYTEVQPPNGLYQPIHFDGKEWIGTPYEEWTANHPKPDEVEEIPDEKDEIIADLSIQLLEAQNAISTVQNDVANLTIQLLERE